jgi:hypothetical protein
MLRLLQQIFVSLYQSRKKKKNTTQVKRTVGFDIVGAETHVWCVVQQPKRKCDRPLLSAYLRFGKLSQ